MTVNLPFSGAPLTSPTPLILAIRRADSLWLVFNRPERRNAVNLEMWRAIPELVGEHARDETCRSIVLTGREGLFISGADIDEFADMRASANAAELYDEVSTAALKALAEAPRPVIAMIDGFCIGGGVGIALACDIRIASDRAVFAIPAARLGLAYSAFGVRQLLNAVSPSRAKQILFSAERIDAQRAFEFGLVDTICETGALTGETEALTRQIAANAPLTIQAAKATVNALGQTGSAEALEQARALAALCHASADYEEGRRAFHEKRLPRFQGR